MTTVDQGSFERAREAGAKEFAVNEDGTVELKAKADAQAQDTEFGELGATESLDTEFGALGDFGASSAESLEGGAAQNDAVEAQAEAVSSEAPARRRGRPAKQE